MKILITGGAGFVGHYLTKNLLNHGFNVEIIDNFSNSDFALQELSKSSVHNFDLAIPEWKSHLIKKNFDVIIHCAAQSSNAISQDSPFQDLDSNQLATLQVLDFCNKSGVKRLIFTSSMSVYGNASMFPTPPNNICLPLTNYAIHKLASEHYIKNQIDLDWTIFRLYTTYGSGQFLKNKKQGLIKIYLSYLIENKPIVVHGDINRIRDIIHVSDVVSAITKSISNKITFNKIYNLGSGKTISVSQILEKLISEFGLPSDYPIKITDADIGDPFKTHADISSLTKDLDWKPLISPLDGIKLTVNAYK